MQASEQAVRLSGRAIRSRIKKQLSPGNIFTYILVLAVVAFSIFPLYYMAITAFKPMDELYLFPPKFYVSRPTWDNFSSLLMAVGSSAVPFTRYIFNSLYTTALTVGLSVVICSMAAYGLAKLRVPGANLIFSVVIAGIMFSTHVTQIPTYMVVNGLHMIDTHWALIVPKLAAAYNMFLMKQFADQLPDAYIEAARIDGATERYIFWRIIMPQLRPAWSTVVVFSFVTCWNDMFGPLVFISKPVLRTLPLAMQTIAGGVASAAVSRAGATAAGTFLMIIPTVLIFLLMQNQVINTMVHSGLKG